jgi:hypothetical protein
MIGDDMVFETKNWDLRILDEFSEQKLHKDKIKMVYCNDKRHGRKISVNAFVHRKYMEINGYFMREEFMVDYIDIWLQHVFLALNRLFYLNDVIIEHLHWSFGKDKKDTVVDRLRGNGNPENALKTWHETKHERINEINNLAKMISIQPDLSRIDKINP